MSEGPQRDRALTLVVALMACVAIGNLTLDILSPRTVITQGYGSPANPEEKAHKSIPEGLWSWWPSPESWTALFTAALTGSTILLWWATRGSVRIAERALTELEKPFINVEISKVTGEFSKIQEFFPEEDRIANSFHFREAELEISNYGRTPAALTYLEYAFVPADRGGIPEPVDCSKIRGRELPTGCISAENKPFSETTNLFNIVSRYDRLLIGEGTKSLWCIGFVRFRDFFGRDSVVGFSFVYDMIGRTFVRRGNNEEYNYGRPENPEDIPSASES